MTPAEKKARDAVVRAAKHMTREWIAEAQQYWLADERRLFRAVSRLLREEAKTKGVRRG